MYVLVRGILLFISCVSPPSYLDTFYFELHHSDDLSDEGFIEISQLDPCLIINCLIINQLFDYQSIV